MKRLKTMRPAVSLATLITALIPLSSTNAGFNGSDEGYFGYGMFAQASVWNWTGVTFANGWTLARYHSSTYDAHNIRWIITGQDGGNGINEEDYEDDWYVLAENYWSGYFHYGACTVIDQEAGYFPNSASAEVD